VATVSSDAIRLWDVDTGSQLFALPGPGFLINSVEFSPDGSRFVTASTDHNLAGRVSVWDAAGGAELAVLTEQQEAAISARFSPDGTSIITTSVDGTARVWNVMWAMGPGDRARASLAPLVLSVCDPTSGKLPGDLRRLTAGDVSSAPNLRGRAGDDVCAALSFRDEIGPDWRTLRHTVLSSAQHH
jgi:WD40 repeat protein